MKKRLYSKRPVRKVLDGRLGPDRAGLEASVGVDVSKDTLELVVRWSDEQFEQPVTVRNPLEVPQAIEWLLRIQDGRQLSVAMESSGTYGDAFRQACSDAGLTLLRVGSKAAHDYAEVFDGVPSQHDGKDAAVIAELAALGKSAVWKWGRGPLRRVERSATRGSAPINPDCPDRGGGRVPPCKGGRSGLNLSVTWLAIEQTPTAAGLLTFGRNRDMRSERHGTCPVERIRLVWIREHESATSRLLHTGPSIPAVAHGAEVVPAGRPGRDNSIGRLHPASIDERHVRHSIHTSSSALAERQLG